jgi:hypothetical protein
MNVDLVDARVERFNDGEIFVEVFENVRDEDMFIIQPTSRPANDALMELLIIADALKTLFGQPRHRCDPLFWLCAPRPSQQSPHADHRQTGGQYARRGRN